MLLTISKNNEKLFEINIDIKSFKKMTKSDVAKINKMVLILDSLGSDIERDEKEYRFAYEMEDKETLIDVEDCSSSKI